MNKYTGKSVRDKWSSKFGFIMSAAGSAVGLGNIWKFPYISGTSGGAIFLLVYIIFVILLGYPILLTELSIGRHGSSNAVSSCEKIRKGWGFAGGIGIIGSVVVLSYYCVVGGWVLKYLITTAFEGVPSPAFFGEYCSSASEPIILQCLFLLINAVIVAFGVSKGIEKVSSVLLPLLLVFMIGLMIYSLTLPNAFDGVKFFLMPDFSSINSFSDIASIVVKALGQVFFSLSLGMGTLITYGSYLDKDTNLSESTARIVTIDTIIAIISGLVILPAVFSIGLEPTEGAGLIFSTLTGVFKSLGPGRFLGTVFFLLVLFAALTSSISLLEVDVTFLIERYKFNRITAVIIPIIVIGAASIPASLSFGLLSDFSVAGMTIFDLFVFLSDQLIMPIGGLLLCILAGWLWSSEGMEKEITSNGKYQYRFSELLKILIRYVSPALIIVVFISSFI